MTGDDELARTRDAVAHAAWEAQQARDPHRIHLTGLTPVQRNAYVQWHATQRTVIRRALRDANAARKALGLPKLHDPLAAAQLAHHDTMLRRLQALCPPEKPPRPKRPARLTPDQQATADTARIRSYAHTHGITIQQATRALKGTR